MSTATEARPELPPIPPKMRHLFVRRGYPVPWFVTWFDNGEPVQRGEGEPDFRVMRTDYLVQAVNDNRCWVCGSRLGRHLSFVIGPMCAVNLTSAEPPCHKECAEFSARACPFLTRPHMKRNEAKDLNGAGEGAGVMLKRNPGVAGVWTVRVYRTRHDPDGGVLFDIGWPESVEWWCEGRTATREEVQRSIATGLPSLRKLAGDSAEMHEMIDLGVLRTEPLLPAA